MMPPAAFRAQLEKVGQRVLSGEMTVDEGAEALTDWVLANARPLAAEILKDWARRIEVAPGRFIHLATATRADLASWRLLARIKRDEPARPSTRPTG